MCWEVPVHERRRRRQRQPWACNARRLPKDAAFGLPAPELLVWRGLHWSGFSQHRLRGEVRRVASGTFGHGQCVAPLIAGRRALCSVKSQVPYLGTRRYSCRRLHRQSCPPRHARRCSAAAAAARAGSPPAAWSAPSAAAAALCRRQWTAAPMREFAMPLPNPAPAQAARTGAAACTGCRWHASKVAVRQVAFSSSHLEKGQFTSPPRRQWGKHEMQPLCRGRRTSWGRSH